MNGFYDKQEVEALKNADKNYFLHPFSSINDVLSNGPKIMERAYKTRLYDVDGKEYIDGFASLWYSNIGHGREEVIEAASDQMTRLDAFHCFTGFSNVPAVMLAEKVSKMVPIKQAKVFFTSSGSEANDSLFKIVRLYWSVLGRDSKDYIISRDKGYHGVGYGSLQATRFPKYQKGFDPFPPGFASIDAPYCYHCPLDKTNTQCSLECADVLEEKIEELGEDRVAAFVAEPVIGAGGIIVPPPGYYEKIRDICTRRNVLFIADEVITGFGRTGKDFGIEHWRGVIPDAMTLAKGITSGYVPLGAAVISDEIYQVLKSIDNFYHGFTYSGHPLACRVALKNIEILERENLKENARKMGERLVEGLRALNSRFIGEVRGKGLIVAVELEKDPSTKEKFDQAINRDVFNHAYSNGVIVRAMDVDLIGFSPPLIIEARDIDRIVEVLGRAIDQVGVKNLS